MNYSIVRYILGQVLKLESILLLLPCLVALIYQEKNGFYFLLTAAIGFLISIAMTIKKPTNHVFYLKEGESFIPKYKEMLHNTGCSTIEESGKQIGVDLTKKEFWENSLKLMAEEIEEFLKM